MNKLETNPTDSYKEKLKTGGVANDLEEIMHNVRKIRPQHQRFIVYTPVEADPSMYSIFEIEMALDFIKNNYEAIHQNSNKAELIRHLYTQYRSNKYVYILDQLKKVYGDDYDIGRFFCFHGVYETEKKAKLQVDEIKKTGFPFVSYLPCCEDDFIQFNPKETSQPIYKDKALNDIYGGFVKQKNKTKEDLQKRKQALLMGFKEKDIKKKEKEELIDVSDKKYSEEELKDKKVEIDLENKIMVSSKPPDEEMNNLIRDQIMAEVDTGNAHLINPEMLKRVTVPDKYVEAVLKAKKEQEIKKKVEPKKVEPTSVEELKKIVIDEPKPKTVEPKKPKIKYSKKNRKPKKKKGI